ncbi:hypothetical protein C1645_740476 [Glomus cerebriforme]|uniref:Cullin family profile domain-containing protein n=1 Tax=Glomus cerebriforme TaxID=658196 RepID=A0A397SLM7_9GLOM|nr:hypothetical protein C1645_740476 [Glomus cerebriforme]
MVFMMDLIRVLRILNCLLVRSRFELHVRMAGRNSIRNNIHSNRNADYTYLEKCLITDIKDVINNIMLAERLLNQCSISEEAELNMISRLEETWPIPPITSNLIIPVEIEKTFQRFKTFYRNKYPSRKPKLLYHLSKGELKANYLKTSRFYTFRELCQNTDIDHGLLSSIGWFMNTLEATVYRIIRGYRGIEHIRLIFKVKQILLLSNKFQPKTTDIKEEIEFLLERSM